MKIIKLMNNIVLFTGAGTSTTAGIPSFRNADNSFWNKYDLNKVANINTFRQNKDEVTTFYNNFRELVKKALPTEFHNRVKLWQDELKSKNTVLTIITQNVDDLFEKAGVENIIHIHGDIRYYKCMGFGHRWFVGYDTIPIENKCPICNCKICKPDVVFFGEFAPEYKKACKILKNLGKTDMLIVIGTSCNVFPIQEYISNGRVLKIFNNMEIPVSFKHNGNIQLFDHVYLESCETAIDKIINLCKNL